VIKTLIGFAVAGLLLRWWLRRETRKPLPCKPYGSSDLFIDPVLVSPEWVPPLGYDFETEVRALVAEVRAEMDGDEP
jgi:hypothetical protein